MKDLAGRGRIVVSTAVRAAGATLLVAGVCAPAVIATAATPTEPGASGIAQQCQDGWQQLEGGDGALFVAVGSCVSYGARGGVLVPRNQAPVAADDTARVGSNVGGVVEVLANDRDADGDALSVSVTGPPAHGTTSVGPTGDVEYVPSLNYSGEDSFTYTVDDGRGGTDTATVDLAVVASPVQDWYFVEPRVVQADTEFTLAIDLNDWDQTRYDVVAVTITDDHGTTSIPRLFLNSPVMRIVFNGLAPGTYDLRIVMSDGQLATAVVFSDLFTVVE